MNTIQFLTLTTKEHRYHRDHPTVELHEHATIKKRLLFHHFL
jgi:hypothetical protein